MPTYVYKFVDTGETIEVQQAFTDATLTEVAHPESGEPMPVKKVFTPVGVTFKGSGFFKTDNRGGSKSESTTAKTSGADSSSTTTSSDSSTSGSTPSTDGTKSDKKADKPSATKPTASTPSSSSGSSST
jgi:predicted nucleic acid-binding Zn ribbon protein